MISEGSCDHYCQRVKVTHLRVERERGCRLRRCPVSPEEPQCSRPLPLRIHLSNTHTLLTSTHTTVIIIIRCVSHLYLPAALQRGVCLSLYPSLDSSMASRLSPLPLSCKRRGADPSLSSETHNTHTPVYQLTSTHTHSSTYIYIYTHTQEFLTSIFDNMGISI